jgi:hypothetical protein
VPSVPVGVAPTAAEVLEVTTPKASIVPEDEEAGVPKKSLEVLKLVGVLLTVTRGCLGSTPHK